MKNFLSIMLVIIMMLVSLPVMAEEFTQDEVFTFDIYDDFYVEDIDEASLMAVDEDVKAEFEKRLLAAWENMDTVVQLYPDIKIHKSEITELFALVYFENPKYYYVLRSFSGTSNSAGYMGELNKLSYTVDGMDAVKATWAEIDKATEEILLYISPDMTDFEKVMTVHDYMVNNYIYDINDTDQTFLIMLDRVGVCAAYAAAFQHVMNTLGIESTLVRSNDMGHIWNMVKIDERWYHVDVTWDDVVPDQFARVNHQFTFLSENAITQLGYHGFTAPYYAGSTVYNKAEWRDDEGAMVTVNGVMYRVEGNNLIDENGNVIYADLDGGDGWWNISKTLGFADEVFAGLCELNGLLYFNTDLGVFSYDPESGATELILEKTGICGMFADENVLRYNAYDTQTQLFVEAGEIRISDIKLAEPYFKNGEAVVRLYNDSDEPLWVISRGDTYKIATITEKGVNTVKFDNGTEQTIYIWKNSLEPVIEKTVIK